EPGAFDGGVKAGARRAGVKHNVSVSRSILGSRIVGAQGLNDRLAATVRIDGAHLGNWQLRSKGSHEQPDHARANNDDAVSRSRTTVPQRVERGLHVGSKRRPLWRDALRDGCQHLHGRIEIVLVGVQAEHLSAHELGWSVLYNSRRAIA